MAKIYYGNQRIDGNEINTENIVDEAITNEKLAANAVSASKIENGSITENKLSAEVQDILDNSIDESTLETALSTKQDVLVSEENIKTINGDSILGSGNLKVTTYQPFKEAWKAKTTQSYTTSQFCSVVNSDADATIGMAYLGGAKWSDMPAGLSNCDVVVEILQGASASVKVMHLTITSGAIAPYHWEYTWWSGSSPNGWIAFQTELDSGETIKTINNQSVLGSGNITTQTVTVADAGGSDVSFDSDDAVKFTAGSNVTLTGNRSAKTVTVAAVDTTYTAGNGLNLSNGEFSVDTTVVATQTDLQSKQDTLIAGANININANNEISATDTTYTAGTNINIDSNSNNAISVISTGATDGQVLTADGDGGAAWEDLPETTMDYNELDNIPIINQSVVLTLQPYIDQQVLNIGDVIFFDKTKETDIIEMLENTVSPGTGTSYKTLLSATGSSGGISIQASYSGYPEANYNLSVGTPYSTYNIYNTLTGFSQHIDMVGRFYIPNDSGSSSYSDSFTISSIYTTTPDWNGTFIGTGEIGYLPQPEEGKYYHHLDKEDNIYYYTNNTYCPIIVNKGENIGKNSIALIKGSVAMGESSVSIGSNLRPLTKDYMDYLTGSGTTYVAQDGNGRQLCYAAVGDYFYYNGIFAKILTRTVSQGTYYGQYTFTVDRTLGEGTSENPIYAQFTHPTTGKLSFSEGYNTSTQGDYSHAEGEYSTAIGTASHAEGDGCVAGKVNWYCTAAHAEGMGTAAIGQASHSEGYQAQSWGEESHAEGRETLVGRDATGGHAEGYSTMALWQASHSEGKNSVASGNYSHSEGYGSKSFQMQNKYSNYPGRFYVEDSSQFSVGTQFRIPGYLDSSVNRSPKFYISSIPNSTDIYVSVVPGSDGYVDNLQFNSKYQTNNWITCCLLHEAAGVASHVEGQDNIANGDYTHVEGKNNIVNYASQHVFGEYADANTAPAISQVSLQLCWRNMNTGYTYKVKILDSTGQEKCALKVTTNTSSSYTYYTYEFPETLMVESGDKIGVSGNYTNSWSLQDVLTATAGGASFDPTNNISFKNVQYTAPKTHGVYIEAVGNGYEGSLSNARTLDWSGNETLAGSITANGASITGATNINVSGSAATSIGNHSAALELRSNTTLNLYAGSSDSDYYSNTINTNGTVHAVGFYKKNTASTYGNPLFLSSDGGEYGLYMHTVMVTGTWTSGSSELTFSITVCVPLWSNTDYSSNDNAQASYGFNKILTSCYGEGPTAGSPSSYAPVVHGGWYGSSGWTANGEIPYGSCSNNTWNFYLKDSGLSNSFISFKDSVITPASQLTNCKLYDYPHLVGAPN